MNEGPPSRLAILNDKIPSLGILLIFFSSGFTTLTKLMVKMLPNLHPLSIVVFRSFVASSVYLVPIYRNGYKICGENRTEALLLVFRGFFGFLSFALNYSALSYIQLADCTTIVTSAPIYTSIFAWIFLKEKCTIKHALLIVITLSGVVMIVRPTFIFGSIVEENNRLLGVLMAFMASVLYSLATVIVRKLKNTPVSVVVIWFTGSSVVYGLIGIAITQMFFEVTKSFDPFNSFQDIIYLLLNSLGGVFAELLITLALQIEEAGVISLTRSVNILMAFITQALFIKKESIQWTSIAGAVIVATSIILSALNKIYEKRKEKAQLDCTGESKCVDNEAFVSDNQNKTTDNNRN